MKISSLSALLTGPVTAIADVVKVPGAAEDGTEASPCNLGHLPLPLSLLTTIPACHFEINSDLPHVDDCVILDLHPVVKDLLPDYVSVLSGKGTDDVEQFLDEDPL